MSAGIEKLKNIGIQKIHEDTHISRAHIEAVFQENFEDMHGVQFNGFLSILEREYGVDLSDLRAKAKEHFGYVAKYMKPEQSTQMFKTDNKKRNLTLFYTVLGVVLFLLFAFISTKNGNEEIAATESLQQTLQNTPPQSQESKIVPLQEQNQTIADENLTVSENNSSVTEQNATQVEKKKELIETVPQIPKTQNSLLKIMPKSKVWVGYIDLQTNEKFQTTSSDELLLDASKEWLLAFGHGNINIELNSVSHEFKTPKNMRFIYKNGVLKQIDVEEYKTYNGGKAW